MEHTFKYAILKAVPDSRRGERVNVGIVVLRDDHDPDIRFSGLAKVRSLAAGDWAGYADRVQQKIYDTFWQTGTTNLFLEKYASVERVIRVSDIALFVADNEQTYERRVMEILDSLVIVPKEERRQRSSRINTEMAAEFRKVNALASNEDMEYSGKIVRDFYISLEEELKADFALQNGVLHATATLDLRGLSVNISRATLPALVLDKATKVFGEKTKRYGVYAASYSELPRFTPHIKILADYSEQTFNWMNPEDRRAYTQRIYSAMNSPES